MRSDTFNLEIPEHLIAQTPAAKRDESRLMVVRRGAGTISHHLFRDLPELLAPNDLLVMNNTRVKPCRLHCSKIGTGGHVELFLLKRLNSAGDRTTYEALTGSWRNITPGAQLELPHGGGLATLVEKTDSGHWRVQLNLAQDAAEAYLEHTAKMPLPPYIKRDRNPDTYEEMDRERYQTVFAKNEGAVAAPTAGLHFTPAVMAALETRGIGCAYITLHVGPGTFRPLKTEYLQDHPMHSEEFSVCAETAAAVAEARTRGGRVVVVGTTSCRTLETLSNEHGVPRASEGSTELFIYPPYRFRCTDALLTNFHLPHSTLIFLVAAWLGENLTRQAYEEALKQEYRFFSYGDAMLCLP